MKVWSLPELDNVVSSLQPLVGSRLQEVLARDTDLVLGFYTPAQRGLLWLWIDLNALRPILLPWIELPLRLKDQKSPLSLFLRAHFRDRVLREVSRHREEGRVVRLSFGRANEDSPLELEVRLFPHGRNVLARAHEKQVAWHKPKALVGAIGAVETTEGSVRPRDLESLREQWLSARQGGKSGRKEKAQDPKARREAELARREKALLKVEDELRRKRDLPWREVGDWLKQNQSLIVPTEWEPFVDKRRKLAWNIENCFERARDLEGKTRGTEIRLQTLKEEIEGLRRALAAPDSAFLAEQDESAARAPLREVEAQGRTLRLNNELVVVAGKSAADNLKLLRKARAWDLWLHLRDFPSSHAILFRNKKTQVNETDLQRAVAWFVRATLGSKFARHAGQKLSVLVAECRHVRPIKGDRLGRVTYHDERVLIFQVPTPSA